MPDPARTIYIRTKLFGSGAVVSFEPRSISLPSLTFSTHREAAARAKAHADAHGWPLVDEMGGARD